MQIYVQNLSIPFVPIFQTLQCSDRNCLTSAWPGTSAGQSCPIHHCSAQAQSSSLKKLCLLLEWLLSKQASKETHASVGSCKVLLQFEMVVFNPTKSPKDEKPGAAGSVVFPLQKLHSKATRYLKKKNTKRKTAFQTLIHISDSLSLLGQS